MSELVRISFTIEETLLKRFLSLKRNRGYRNRSEFIRDLIRQHLVEEEWKQDEEAIGTITLLYNHEARRLSEKLTSLQHHHHKLVLATTHVHLDQRLCAEMIMVKGKPSHIEEMADTLRQQKGVLHATVSMSSTGKKLL